MTPFWEGFVEGLAICAIALVAVGLGALFWLVLSSIVGGGWALAIIISALIFSGLMGLFYACDAYDEQWENEP